MEAAGALGPSLDALVGSLGAVVAAAGTPSLRETTGEIIVLSAAKAGTAAGAGGHGPSIMLLSDLALDV